MSFHAKISSYLPRLFRHNCHDGLPATVLQWPQQCQRNSPVSALSQLQGEFAERFSSVKRPLTSSPNACGESLPTFSPLTNCILKICKRILITNTCDADATTGETISSYKKLMHDPPPQKYGRLPSAKTLEAWPKAIIKLVKKELIPSS
jgi:hypothetical protein